MPLELFYKASQKVKLTPSYPEGKTFADIEDACFVLKHDLSDVTPAFTKDIVGGGIVKDVPTETLIMDILLTDFDSGTLEAEINYEIGYAVKFTSDPIWYKPKADYEGKASFNYPRINK